MKKRTILPLVFLLTFTLWLTPTPAADEWVPHKTITRPGGRVRDIAFNKDAGELIVGSRYNPTEYNVQVYDATTFGYQRGRDYGGANDVYSVATRKGWYEAAVGTHGNVYLYNTLRSTTLKTFSIGSGTTAYSLAYRPDGDRLAVGTSTGYIHYFYTDHRNGTRRLLRRLKEHIGPVNTVAWSPNGSILASGGDDGTVRLWNPETGVNFAVLRGHTARLTSVKFSPDGITLATSSNRDGTVRIWDVNTRRLLRTLNSGGGSMAFHPSKQILAVGRKLYNPSNGVLIKTIDSSVFDSVAFHPNGNFFAAATPSRSEVRIYKLITVNPLDATKDGKVDINDLIAVARDYGKTGSRATDVNNDNRVDIKDLTEVARAVNPNFASPSVAQELPTFPFTAQEIQQWIQDAKAQGINADGIATLEQLLTVVLQQASPPRETTLFANYPNPFNPETWIPYQLAKPAEVKVSIHSADGRLVRTLELGQLPAGVYQEKDRAAYWDGKNEQGESVASGVYFYTLKAGDFSATKKMLIRK